MAMKITTDEITKAQKFREKLKVEIDKSLPKEIIALFPTTPFSSPKCGQSDDQLGSYRKKLMEFRTSNAHRKIHCLLLCYEQQWKELKFVKRRESKHCCHYSQYDDVNVE